MVQPKDLSSRPGRITVAFLFVVLFTLLLFLGSMGKALFPSRYERLAYGLIGTVVALLLTWVFLRWDRVDFSWVGLRWEAKTPVRFIMGLLMGLGLTALVMAFVSGYANVGIDLNPDFKINSFLIGCVAIFFLAWMEEIAFRAYPLVILQRSTGVWTTQITIAVLFALYHIATGWNSQQAFLGPGSWSLIFGLAAIRSGGIAMSTGLHFAANLAQSSVGEGQFPIWSMHQNAQDIPTMLASIRSGGTLTQIGILTTGLVLTWIYVRQRD